MSGVGDVQFGDALLDLQWRGDTKSSAIPDLRTLRMKANAGFNVFDDPHQELILAQFSLQVVGNGRVDLAFDAKDCTGNQKSSTPMAISTCSPLSVKSAADSGQQAETFALVGHLDRCVASSPSVRSHLRPLLTRWPRHHGRHRLQRDSGLAR